MRRDPAADLAAIEEFHRRDAAAAKAGDTAALRAIIANDAVIMPPGGRAQRGKAEIDAAYAATAGRPRTHEVTDYAMAFDEVEIIGDFAFETGRISGAMRDLADGSETRSVYHVMRILKRMPDGTWKVYRSIWAAAGE